MSIHSFILLVVLVCTGCYKPHLMIPAEQLRLPMPTKDEIALVDGRPLSISAYLFIRKSMSDHSNTDALWAGISMLSLQNKTRAAGKELSPTVALSIARYALRDLPPPRAINSLKEYYHFTTELPSPDLVKQELEKLNQKSLVKRNPIPLSSIE